MTERLIDIGQAEGVFIWDDEVYDPDTETYVPATYSDGTPMKGMRADSIHLNSDASADSDAVRKSQMTTAMAGYVSKTDFPLDLGTLENGDMLFYNAVDEGWQDLAFLDGSSQILLARIPATLTGKDADTVDGIEGSALLKKDGTVALTGDWDIGSGRKIKGDQIIARSANGLFLGEDSGTYGVFVNDSGKIEFIGTGGASGEVDINGDVAFQGAFQAGGDIRTSGGALLTSSYIQIDDTGVGMFRRDTDSDSVSLWINKVGYNGGTTRYRDLTISDGKGNAVLFVDGSAAVLGIGTTSPDGKMEIEVGSTAAIAALVLDQDDEDQPFIVFEGTSDTGLSKNITTDEDSGGVLNGPALYVRVKVGSSTYWLPLYGP